MLDWPNSITSRHHHIRKRAEAYASALYYSECSMSGVSPDGAAAAEDNARSRQNRWWLKGNDPNHPSLQGRGTAEVKPLTSTAGASSQVVVAEAENLKKPSDNETYQVAEENGGDQAQTDDENDSDGDAASIQADDEILDDDENVPILARDDDLGSSFGTLSNFSSTNFRKSSASMTSPHLVTSTNSPLLPSWLNSSPQTSPETSSSPDVFKQEFGSTEEVLTSYSSSSYPILSEKKAQTDLFSKSLPLPAVAQVTSESEVDGLSCSDDTNTTAGSSAVFYPKPRYQQQGLDSTLLTVVKSRKRVRADVSSILDLDETYLEAQIETAKAELLSRLENEGISPAFRSALASLEKYSKLKASTNKKRKSKSNTSSTTQSSSIGSTDIDGTWFMVSPPEYPSCLGKNEDGEPLFSLGRMAFDMYQPSELICSIQKQYNTITSVETKDLPQYVPKSLRREVDNERNRDGSGRLKTYNIIASFTIEDSGETSTSEDEPQGQTQKLRGIMTSYGYALPDPIHPDRKSIWFSGGTIEPADDDQLDEWIKMFGTAGPTKSPEDETKDKDKAVEAEKARTLASRILLGAVPEPIHDDGTLGYHLNRPIGGHGSAYVDVVYMDDELRVMRGHSGSIYVFKRV